MFVLLILCGLSFSVFAQTATLMAPWLLVYDAEGRPRWEIRMEKLVRTKDGWEGEKVSVTLFFQGEPSIFVEAEKLSADPLGRRWSLKEEVSGQGHGFSFTAKEASWTEHLVLLEFSAQREDLTVFAEEAHWELNGLLELFSATASSAQWSLCFSYGQYKDGTLFAQEVEAEGFGLKIQAEYLEFSPDEGRAKFRGVKVVRSS